MITLQKLKIFAAVYEHHSFNQAAKVLYLSQATISQHIHDLEVVLGVSLFERSYQGVEPTQAADVYYGYVKLVFSLLAEAESAVMRIEMLENQHLALCATPGLSVYIVPGWMQKFRQAYPNVEVTLQTNYSFDVVKTLLGGDIDLGFAEGDIDNMDDMRLGKFTLMDVVYRVVVYHQHAWAGRSSITPEELNGQSFITRRANSRARRWWEGVLGEAGITMKNTLELDSPGAIKYAMLDQMGIALLPDYAIEREVKRGDLAALSIDGVKLERTIHMLWDNRQPFTPLQRAFLNGLTERFPGLRVLI